MAEISVVRFLSFRQKILNFVCLHIQCEIIVIKILAHLQSSVFKLSKDLIDSIHEEGIVAYTS